MAKIKHKKESCEECENIIKWQNDPKFMRAVREFIRLTTS